ncbi:MAG: FAD-dependent oxidoreductase [Eubacteriales bacterium]
MKDIKQMKQTSSQYDVIVTGAGVAGFAAAVAAARLGLKTMLLEQNGMAGGVLTVGGNSDIAQFFVEGKQIISGIGWEFVKRLESIGGAEIPDMQKKGMSHDFYGVHVNIPLAANLMDEMLLESGVELFYEQPLCDVSLTEENGRRRIGSVKYATKDGLHEAGAKVFIDCTGDGTLSVLAGAGYEVGERSNGKLELQPGTVRYFLPELKLDRMQARRLTETLESAIGDGTLKDTDTLRYSVDILDHYHGNNVNHISCFDFSDSNGKTLANIEGRRCVARIIGAFRRAGIEPGIEMISPETAVRESRRILCDGYITVDDYLSARKYDDGVCNTFYPVDLHRDEMGGIYQVFLEDGKIPQIPLSAMTVRGLDNLFVAGRCISGDRLANSAVRVKASCMAMGQACAVAASVAIRENNGNSRGICTDEVRKILRSSGAIVPD